MEFVENQIKSIRFYGKHLVSIPEREIQFSTPNQFKPYVIDVICGRNRSGKSHILKRISKCVFQHNDNINENHVYYQNKLSDDDIDIFLKFYDQTLGNCVYIDDILLYLKYASSISVRRDSSFRKRGINSRKSEVGNQYILKDSLDSLTKEILNSFGWIELDDQKWEDSDEYRESLHSGFKEAKIYKISENIPLVKELNRVFCGDLYFSKRVAKRGEITYELHIAFDENQCLHYTNWSNGQKVLFVSMVLITYYRPSIFLFDEIENHLHPEYISVLFKYLKKNVIQSIISTHHPHIIFSKYVDSVWYLEIQRKTIALPDILPKGNRLTNKAPERKVYEIEKNIDRLIYTYKLFDNYDTQLLRISSATLASLNELVIDVFKRLYIYEVVDSKRYKEPDIQAEKLFQLIHSKLVEKTSISILEIGAGTGRILKELMKINKESVCKTIHWTLLEPESDILLEEIQNLSIDNCTIISDIDQVNTSFDFSLFINVLHELRPDSISEYIYALQKKMKIDGDIIVVELFPLLYPEKFSIPMGAQEWAKLFRALGMRVQINAINIKNANVEAFWLKIRVGSQQLPEDEILQKINVFLKDELMVNRCADYSGRTNFNDMDGDIIRTMCELTTIASITSYLNGQW
jgi:energy-coupling factor transporter ATP-binding protein EcfA2